jgi:hypothetical protein
LQNFFLCKFLEKSVIPASALATPSGDVGARASPLIGCAVTNV